MNLNEDELQAERRRLAAAFDGVLNEPVPERLRSLLREPAATPTATVTDLHAARTQRRTMSSWTAWGGMAASLVIGTALGTRLQTGGDSDARQIVRGPVAQALESQLASAAGSSIAVPISFMDKKGRYCRAFTSERDAGLACREADGVWDLQALAVAPAGTGGTGAMRQASSVLPTSILEAVDAAMAGEALNADQERAARDGGWR